MLSPPTFADSCTRVSNQLTWLDFADDVPLMTNLVTIYDPRFPPLLEHFSQVPYFAIDIETYGEEEWHPLHPIFGHIRLIQLAFSSMVTASEHPYDVLVVDLGGWRDDRDDIDTYLNSLNFWDILYKQLASTSTIKIGHNLKFDIGFLYSQYGLRVRNIRDTMIGSQVYWSGVGVKKAGKGDDRSERCTLSHSLKAVVERLLGREVDKSEQKSNWGWELTNSQLNYAAMDTIYTIQAWLKLGKMIKVDEMMYSAMAEFGAVPVFAEMESVGYPINLTKAEEAILAYQEYQNQVLQPFKDKFPDVQWSSNQQVLEVFKSNYDKQLEAVNEYELQLLLKKYPNDLVIQGILDARTLSVYIAYVQKVVNVEYRGSVRTHFRQIAPSGTGRSSCKSKVSKKAQDTGVQLQNSANLQKEWKGLLPAPRSVFEAPDNYNLLILDLSQAHQRIAAELSHDATLSEVYNNGKDSHTLLGLDIASINGKNWSEETMVGYLKLAKKGSTDPEHVLATFYRQLGKMGNYSQLNQAGVQRVLAGLKQEGVNATEADAKAIQVAWRTLYAGLYRFIKQAVAKADSYNLSFAHLKDINGYPILELYGTLRGLTGRRQFLAKQDNKGKLQIAYTDSISSFWLNSEADFVKEFMGQARSHLDNHPEYSATIINCVHDQVDFCVKSEYALQLATELGIMLKNVMERWIKSIPVEDSALEYKDFIAKSLAEK